VAKLFFTLTRMRVLVIGISVAAAVLNAGFHDGI